MPRWPLHKAYFWQEAPFFRPLLALITGIVIYDCGLVSARYFMPGIILLLCSGILLLATALVRSRSKLLDIGYAVCLPVFFALLGWCAYASGDSRNSREWYGRYIDTGSADVVRITDDPQERAATTKAVVDVLYRVHDGRLLRVAGKALVYLYRRPGAASIAQGDTLIVPARWKAVRNGGNPFEFDNAAFQRRKGILFQQFLSPEDIVIAGKANSRDAGFVARTHSWCNRQLTAYVPDSAARGLLQAMLLGDESAFDPELRQAYSQTGVIHIVSISGSHVAVLFLVVTGLLFWVRGRHGAWIRYLVGVVLVWLYVLIAGAPPSALRSAIMFTVIAVSMLTEREGQSLNTIMGAAFVLLAGEPAWLFSVGFQLSFGAVLSLLLFYQPVYRLWPQSGWLTNKAWQAVAASIAAEILTAPLVVYYFHNFPLLFIIANLLSVVLVGFCALVGGMAIIALCWIPPLARTLGWIVTQLISIFNAAITRMQHVNPESFQYLQINAAELLLAYLLITALAMWRLQREQRALFAALPAACALLILLGIDQYRALRQDKLVVYSSGQHPVAERISGGHFTTLFVESKTSAAYTIRAAHTGWHAWKSGAGSVSSYVMVGGRKVLVLSDTVTNAFTNPLPVDVLIICRPLRQLRVSSVLNAFRPREVVLARRPSAYHLQRWGDSCAAHGAHLYNVAETGAYLME